MVGYRRHIGIAAAALAAALLAVGWVAVAQTGFERVYLVPVIAASIGFALAVAGAFARRPWVFGGGLLAAFVFCPSPFGFWPLVAGAALLTLYAGATYRAVHEEEDRA